MTSASARLRKSPSGPVAVDSGVGITRGFSAVGDPQSYNASLVPVTLETSLTHQTHPGDWEDNAPAIKNVSGVEKRLEIYGSVSLRLTTPDASVCTLQTKVGGVTQALPLSRMNVTNTIVSLSFTGKVVVPPDDDLEITIILESELEINAAPLYYAVEY